MAGFVGADIEQISVLATLFERKAQALRHIAAGVNGFLDGCSMGRC